LPLVHCKGRDYAVFFDAQSCQKPKTYSDPDANARAELSAKLNYILCISRFVHCLKVMSRDRIGSFTRRTDYETFLNSWIQNYVHLSPESCDAEEGLTRPLAAAKIQVQAVQGMPRAFEMLIFLRIATAPPCTFQVIARLPGRIFLD
jgi:type VI secretion system protein ImpC